MKKLRKQYTVFYRRQKEFFEKGLLPSSGKPRTSQSAELERIAYLQKEDSDQGRGSGRADGGASRAKKRHWGTLIGTWATHDTRDQIVDFVRCWLEKTRPRRHLPRPRHSCNAIHRRLPRDPAIISDSGCLSLIVVDYVQITAIHDRSLVDL